MDIGLYYNHSDHRMINKDIEYYSTVSGTLEDATSIMYPSVMIDSSDILRVNYCYIPEFRRYYSIKEVTSFRTGLWRVSMECDVLMSFRGDIMALQAIIDKQAELSKSDLFIDDGTYIAEKKMTTNVVAFPYGLPENPNIILITAG